MPIRKLISGVELDYDKGAIPLEEAVEILRKANLRALVYSSASHIPGIKERWRILLPLSKSLPTTERAALTAWVNGLFGGQCADESFVLSQAYLYGHIDGAMHHEVVLDGDSDLFDLRPDLEAGFCASCHSASVSKIQVR